MDAKYIYIYIYIYIIFINYNKFASSVFNNFVTTSNKENSCERWCKCCSSKSENLNLNLSTI